MVDGLVDALCWALLASMAAQALLGRRRWRRFLERAAIPGERVRFYRRAMLNAWIRTAVWIAAARLGGATLADIGLRRPQSPGAWIDALYAIGFLGGLLAPLAIGPVRRAAIGSFGALAQLLPRTSRERVTFAGVALTAGFCEEMLYRSFLLALMTRYAPSAPPWIWLVVGSVPFGLAHAYQGKKGVVLTGLVGLAATWLYLVYRSLWVPIALHAAIDLRALAFSWWLPAAAPSAEAAASDRAAT